MIAAVYARKSTAQDGTAEEAKSVARQVEGARRFIKARGWTLHDEHVYEDDGVSGALFSNRPSFQRMLRDAAAGAFEAVVFFDLDRFGRNASKTMEALHRLMDVGVEVWDYSTGLAVDLDSFAGETMTFLKARFAQEQQAQIRKHTRDSLRRKAERGEATGGRPFGYDNTGPERQRVLAINEAEADIVRAIYRRFAAGEGARSIAQALNDAKVPSIRAQRGRVSGWGPSTIRAVLARPLYRGQIVWGRRISAYGRELGKRRKTSDGRIRESGQLPLPEDQWIRVDAPHLRIVEQAVADRVDARMLDRRTRYLASVARGDGRVPERAHGKYLLSGGMLLCPECGGHFEARKHPWKGNPGEVYSCATRRRKPGKCNNTLALPIAEADETVLSLIEADVLGTRLIEELLSLVDTAPDPTLQLHAERKRLEGEIDNLVRSVAKGMPADTIAPIVKEHQAAIARLDVKLRNVPKGDRPDIETLRRALQQRSDQWRRDLRAEPKVARILIRRVLEPIELWVDEPLPEWMKDGGEAVKFEAGVKPGLLDDLSTLLGTSPAGFEPAFWP